MSKAETGFTTPAPCERNGLSANEGSTDRELIALAADLHAANLHHEAMCGADDEPATEAASAAMMALIDRMAATPAASLTGAAAKMGRLCHSLSERQGRSLWYAEHAVVDSLADDLLRLVPTAVPSLPAPLPMPQREPEPLPEPEWLRAAHDEGERLAAMGLARRAGFTGGDVQLVSWLLDRIAADMGEAAAARVRDLCGMDESSLSMMAEVRARGLSAQAAFA